MFEQHIRVYHIPTQTIRVFLGKFLSRKHMINLLATWQNEFYIYGPMNKPINHLKIITQDHTTDRPELA